MEYNFPKDTPKAFRNLLTETLSKIHVILKDNLIGIYLHGSLAMGCFQPDSSDIDLILVVEKKPTKEERNVVMEYLKRVSSKEKRIEMSIVIEKNLRNPQYPMEVELHYEYSGEAFQNEKDNEIISNLFMTSKRGFCIWGKPINEIFSAIPAEYHLGSVLEDIEHTRKYLNDNPVYWILNSCRILAFIRENKVLSKLEGGEWGIKKLPKKYRRLVEKTLLCYQGRKTKKDIAWNTTELGRFADYMIGIIKKESEK